MLHITAAHVDFISGAAVIPHTCCIVLQVTTGHGGLISRAAVISYASQTISDITTNLVDMIPGPRCYSIRPTPMQTECRNVSTMHATSKHVLQPWSLPQKGITCGVGTHSNGSSFVDRLKSVKTLFISLRG